MIIECKSCNAHVDGQLLSEFTSWDDELSVDCRYCFLRCPRCGDPLLAWQYDLGEGWEPLQRLYPPGEAELDWSIPGTIRSSYVEARNCLKAESYIATVLMCRRALEAIADASGVQVRNLSQALKDMRDLGLIERRLYEWADALRMVGNEAAHDMATRVEPQDAADILEFTLALMQYVYTFQKRFNDFVERRKGPDTSCSSVHSP